MGGVAAHEVIVASGRGPGGGLERQACDKRMDADVEQPPSVRVDLSALFAGTGGAALTVVTAEGARRDAEPFFNGTRGEHPDGEGAMTEEEEEEEEEEEGTTAANTPPPRATNPVERNETFDIYVNEVVVRINSSGRGSRGAK